MKSKNLLWLILVVSLSYYGYLLYSQWQNRPCARPIEYHLGTFDQRFGISQADFLATIKAAGDVWEQASGKDLFELKAKGDLTVNLIYDQRQQVTQQNNVLTSDIDQTKQAADALKQNFLALKEQYRARPSQELAEQINSLIDQYNLLVKQINANVGVVNSGAGREFKEGEFVADERGERINIYQFDDQAKLKRVLIHELGHALGLDHNNNPDSIMYALNQSANQKPTKEDLASLKTLCGILN